MQLGPSPAGKDRLLLPTGVASPGVEPGSPARQAGIFPLDDEPLLRKETASARVRFAAGADEMFQPRLTSPAHDLCLKRHGQPPHLVLRPPAVPLFPSGLEPPSR